MPYIMTIGIFAIVCGLCCCGGGGGGVRATSLETGINSDKSTSRRIVSLIAALLTVATRGRPEGA